jgi:hypothetical protein
LQHDAVQHATALLLRQPADVQAKMNSFDPASIHDDHTAGAFVAQVAALLTKKNGAGT